MPEAKRAGASSEQKVSTIRLPAPPKVPLAPDSIKLPDRRTFLVAMASTSLAAATLPHLSVLADEAAPSEFDSGRRGAEPLQIVKLPKNKSGVRAPHGGEGVQDLLDYWPEPVAGRSAISAAAAIHQFKAYNYMPTTHAHELLHSMQSAVTARYGEGSQFERRVKVSDPKNSAVTFTPLSMAAVYLGQGKLAFVPTPENISLRQLADFLPPSLRVEPYFKSYISQPALLDTSAGQLFSFAQPTSHLIDEFSCRHLGAEMALGLVEATVRFNHGNVNGKSFFDPGIEPLILFSLALGVLAAQKGAVFSRAGDREQFFAAIRFLVERSAWLNAEIAKSPDMRPILRPDFEAGHVLRIFLRAPDCAEFRGRVKEVFGPEMYELLSLDPRGELLARSAHFQELGAELLASAGGM